MKTATLVESKPCRQCGTLFNRRLFPSGRLEDIPQFGRRQFCCLHCAGVFHTKPDASRAAHQKRAVKFRKSACEECDRPTELHAHHKDGNQKNTVASNIQTLCASCHLKWHWKNGKTPTPRTNTTCSVCGRPARKAGMCQKHYIRKRKYGNPLLTRKLGRGKQPMLLESPSTSSIG